MKVYTKTGDLGETGTFVGRMSKADVVAEALGSLDELNSWIGLCRSQLPSHKSQATSLNEITKLNDSMKQMQHNLLVIGTLVAGSKKYKVSGRETTKLEKLIDKLDKDLPRLHNFIFPKNNFQVARAVARRTERRVVAAQIQDKSVLKYLNRLSDTLFVIGRWVAKQQGEVEEVWKG